MCEYCCEDYCRCGETESSYPHDDAFDSEMKAEFELSAQITEREMGRPIDDDGIPF